MILPGDAVKLAQALVVNVQLPHIAVLPFQLVLADSAVVLHFRLIPAFGLLFLYLLHLLFLAVGQVLGKGRFQQAARELATADNQRHGPVLYVLLHLSSHSFPWIAGAASAKAAPPDGAADT